MVRIVSDLKCSLSLEPISKSQSMRKTVLHTVTILKLEHHYTCTCKIQISKKKNKKFFERFSQVNPQGRQLIDMEENLNSDGLL